MVRYAVALPYNLFFVGTSADPQEGELTEFAMLFPNNRLLFFPWEDSFAWDKMKKRFKKEGLHIFRDVDGEEEHLTIEVFESKWLRANEHELKLDPLADRGLDGWYDSEGYCFVRDPNEAQSSKIKMKSAADKLVASENDMVLVKKFQDRRQEKLVASISQRTPRRRRNKRG